MKYNPIFGWDRDEHVRRVRYLRWRRVVVLLLIAATTVVVAGRTFRRCGLTGTHVVE